MKRRVNTEVISISMDKSILERLDTQRRGVNRSMIINKIMASVLSDPEYIKQIVESYSPIKYKNMFVD